MVRRRSDLIRMMSFLLPAAVSLLTGLPAAVLADSSGETVPPAPQVYTPESHSLATVDGMTAVLHNPAGIGLQDRGFYVGGSQTESEWSSLSVLGQVGSLGFGYQHWSDDFYGANQDHYLLGWAFQVGPVGRLGCSSSWWRAGAGTDRKAWSYAVSFLARPSDWLSLAGKAENINRPRFGAGVMPRMFRAAAGLRPLSTRLTLTFDASTDEIDRWDGADYRWGFQIEPLDGFLASASVDQDKTLHVGFGINAHRRSLGVVASQTDNDRLQSRSIYAVFRDQVNRTRFLPRRFVAKFGLGGRYRDEPNEAAFTLGSYQGASRVTSAIREAVDNESVSGIAIDIWGMTNLAVAQEIRSELLRARRSGKKVLVYVAAGGSLTDYLVASAADTIVLPEVTGLGPFGLVARTQMLKGLLDKLGVEFERYPCRKCPNKSAYFPLTEDEVPEAFRNEMNSILDDWLDQLTADISDARGLPWDEFEELCDGRIILASEAKELGLVDVLAYSDLSDSLMIQMARARIVDGMKLAEEKHRRYTWHARPAVAVIAAMGGISLGENRSSFFDGNVIGAETLVRTIRSAQNDPDVRAVVLRIDSPGGSGYASDIIWHQIDDLKRRTDKPFVSSMGIMAASGGYYIAMNSDRILASPATLTGSIGVTGLKPVTAGFQSKIGIRNEIFKRGEHIDMFASHRKTTEKERNMILDVVDNFYDVFTSKVADGRGRTQEEIYELGGGRVYTGRQALANGLVDRLGGLREAIEIAAEMAGIEGHPRVLYYHRPRKTFWQRLRGLPASETPNLETIFEARKPMTYSEVAAALAEMQ